MAWREAFFIYTENKNVTGVQRKEEILNLQSIMNRKRESIFHLPIYKILITPYWLLGFIEGEGSLSQKLVQAFELAITISEKPLMIEIYNYILSLIPKDLENENKFKSSISLRERPSNS